MANQQNGKEAHLYKIRHSLAHVMAQAVTELYPEAKLGIGPPIDTGFYYDLYRGYQERLSGPGHLLNRMKGFWTYFALTFERGKRIAKQIHRCKRIDRYEAIVSEFFSNKPRWVEPGEGMSVDEMLP